MRIVMVTYSEASLLPAMADSIRRRSGLFSNQKSASASSLSKMGTSSHLAMARIVIRPQMDTDRHRCGANCRHEFHEFALIHVFPICVYLRSSVVSHSVTAPASGRVCAGKKIV